MLRWIEGFEAEQLSTYLARRYVLTGAVTSFSTARKTGLASLRATTFSLTTPKLVAVDENTWVVGFGFYCEAVTGGQEAHIDLQNDAGEQVHLLFIASTTTTGAFNVRVVRGSTTIATSVDLNANQWHYFEWKAVVRTGTNGSFDLKRNGVSILSGVTLNLANQGSDGANRALFVWGNGGATFTRMDDIYILDSTGALNNDFLGPQVILHSLPDADGDSSQWLPSSGSVHFSLVDDPVNTASDTDDVSSDTDGEIDLYQYADLATLASGTTIHGVSVQSMVRMRSSGSRDLKVRVKSGGSTADGALFTVGNTLFRTESTIFEQNPIGPAAWTKSSIDAAQVGINNVQETP